MKKLSLCLLLCLALCLSLVVCASAEDTLEYVTDAAGILTASERESLNSQAAALSEQYQCALYIVVLQDYKAYNEEGVEACTEELYHYFDLGWGEGHDGLILLLSMAERDYDLWGYGPLGRTAFTEYGLSRLEDSFLPYFRGNNWFGGFQAYLRGAESMLSAAAAGEPVSYRMPMWQKILLALCPSSLVGFIVNGVFKSQMKTAKEKRDADEYVVKGKAQLRIREDRFTHQTRTVRTIETSSGGSRGGGGGTSHHSGKF